MLKVIAAALVAIFVFFEVSLAPEAVEASPPPVVKGDRLDVRVPAPACSKTAWPYYESHCLRTASQNAQPRTVRIIPIERPASKHANFASVN